jgi:pyruvate dehydrogenase E2 component (dihydrolipoamide acetyltransferase)
LEARKKINNHTETKISVNDFIIKAVAMALEKHPGVNSSWLGDTIRQYHHIHIGSAIALEEGLIVPVVRHANTKSLSQIAADAASLYDKARNKKIQPAEFTGNTFTISNLGMMGIDEFTAIVNPPDACILAVGKTTPTPVVEGTNIEVRQVMKLTLSCDHRVVDGAVGARFLQTLKAYLEEPLLMFV